MVSKLILPAIDIYRGMFVRLKKGNYGNITVFNKRRLISNILDINPYTVHIVDLEGANCGKPINASLILSLIYRFTSLGIKTQVGGGIRSIVSIGRYVLLGSSVILGTSIIKDNIIYPCLIPLYNYVIISIDFKNNYVYYNGWRYKGPSVKSVIYNINNTLFSKLIFTDIDRDGTLSGINLNNIIYLSKLLCSRKLFLFAGGFNNLTVSKLDSLILPNFLGFISGKFIYYG
ncbi:HisA/HisF-related TIM barrel protein [Candidatus Vidania fulgoroideorum]